MDKLTYNTYVHTVNMNKKKRRISCFGHWTALLILFATTRKIVKTLYAAQLNFRMKVCEVSTHDRHTTQSLSVALLQRFIFLKLLLRGKNIFPYLISSGCDFEYLNVRTKIRRVEKRFCVKFVIDFILTPSELALG